MTTTTISLFFNDDGIGVADVIDVYDSWNMCVGVAEMCVGSWNVRGR